MDDKPETDPYLKNLLLKYKLEESTEIEQYLQEWDASTYASVAQSVLDHSLRKDIDPLKYLRKAHNFSKSGAKRIPKKGYHHDGSAVYRKNNEYLIVRANQFGDEKIVTYGVNDD
jgi:hypothetical protein